jgi:hypothetical protein
MWLIPTMLLLTIVISGCVAQILIYRSEVKRLEDASAKNASMKEARSTNRHFPSGGANAKIVRFGKAPSKEAEAERQGSPEPKRAAAG